MDRDSAEIVKTFDQQLSELQDPAFRRAIEGVLAAAASAIPGIGIAVAAAQGIRSANTAAQVTRLQNLWLQELQLKWETLERDFVWMADRLNQMGPDIIERLESEEYLALVRRAFRGWDRSETAEKRKLFVNLITNAAATAVAEDDLVRMFSDWLDSFDETHLRVISFIFNNPGCTRYDIGFHTFNDSLPFDDSPLGDLFRLLVRDLSTGGVIRQARESDATGRFRKAPRAPRRRGTPSEYVESSFEDTKPYGLTELGKQFVHYTLKETVLRVE